MNYWQQEVHMQCGRGSTWRWRWRWWRRRAHSHWEAPAASRLQGSLTIELRVAVDHRRDPDQNLTPVPLHHQLQPPAGLLDQLPGVAEGQILRHRAVDLKERRASDPFGPTFCSPSPQTSKCKTWDKFAAIPSGLCPPLAGCRRDQQVRCWSSLWWRAGCPGEGRTLENIK